MEGRVYEAELIFNEDKFTEKELEAYLKTQFKKKSFVRKGYKVNALFYIPYDKYTNYEDQMDIAVGYVLRAGDYGVCKDYY